MKVVIPIVVAATVLLFACTPQGELVIPTPQTSPQVTSSPEAGTEDADDDGLASPKTVTLTALNNSGQNGTAVLTEVKEGKTTVTLNLLGGTFTQPQPAHIHVGSCPGVEAIKYPLNNVVNGKSETVLNVDLEEIVRPNNPLAVNVHKSAAEQSTYTACGEINE